MRFCGRKLTKCRLVTYIAIAIVGFFGLLQRGTFNLQYLQNNTGSGDSPVSHQSGEPISKDGSIESRASATKGSPKLINLDKPIKYVKTEKLNEQHNDGEKIMHTQNKARSKGKIRDDLLTHNKNQQNSKRTSFMQLAKEVNPTLSIQNDKKYPPKQLRILVSKLNRRQKILNIDKFPSRPKDGIILIVQVHKRLEYLAELLDSLDKVSMIENVLLVISHDYYSTSINEVIKQIEFCQVLQIFFPFSMQLYPKEFPGIDPNDCPRDLSKDEAKARKCNNAMNPDQYGHYREAPYVMTKHHWWWKANAVFDQLSATRDHKGPIMFLEEDHYVTPDFYHNLVLLHRLRKSMPDCKEHCHVLSLGTYSSVNSYQYGSNRVTLTRWRSYDHNMGMILYRDTWKKIRNCAKLFCTYDDYNWDWTLMYMSLYCIATPLKVLAMDFPRVYHIGECGMHHKKDCNAQETIQRYKQLIQDNLEYMFPKKLEITNIEEGNAHTGMQNGGWGDPRDHTLCLSFVRTFKR